VPVSIVGMGYNNNEQIDNRTNISLDPRWSPAEAFRVIDTTYSLIDRNLGETWATGAAGSLDERWRQGMRNVRETWGSRRWLFIRPAHEFNGQGLWYVDAGDEQNFKAAWARFYAIVQEELVREGRPTFVVYCPNRESWDGHAEASEGFYPGDAYVDVIGVDYYDNKRARNEREWQASGDARTAHGNPHGLFTWQTFARDHGKPFALPEWGLESSETPDTVGEVPNDNAFFIAKMNAFFRDHAGSGPGEVLYEQYFTSWASNQLHPPTMLPAAAAQYEALDWSDGSGVMWPR
jgi:hypothetical protein